MTTLLASAALAAGIGCSVAPTRSDQLQNCVKGPTDVATVTSTDVLPNDKFNLQTLRAYAQQYQYMEQNRSTISGINSSADVAAINSALTRNARVIQHALAHSDGNVYLFLHGQKNYGTGNEHRVWPTRTSYTPRELSDVIAPLTTSSITAAPSITNLDAAQVIDLVAHVRPNYSQSELEGRMTSDQEGSNFGLVFLTRGLGNVRAIIGETPGGVYLVDRSGAPVGTRIDSGWHNRMTGTDYTNGVYDGERPAALSLVLAQLYGRRTE